MLFSGEWRKSQRCCFDSVREQQSTMGEKKKKNSWHGMINVWQRWKWLPPDLIWNALPVPLNLTDSVTYSLALSDRLLYGLKVRSVATCSYLNKPMCNFWHFHRAHTESCVRCSYGGVQVTEELMCHLHIHNIDVSEAEAHWQTYIMAVLNIRAEMTQC